MGNFLGFKILKFSCCCFVVFLGGGGGGRFRKMNIFGQEDFVDKIWGVITKLDYI